MSLKVLNMRVSYHDMVMFLAIVNSLPLQARQAQQTQHQTFAPSSERTKDLASTGTSTSAAWSVGSGKKQVTRGTFGGSASSETARVQDNMTKSMMGGLSIPCVNRGSDKGDFLIYDYLRLHCLNSTSNFFFHCIISKIGNTLFLH